MKRSEIIILVLVALVLSVAGLILWAYFAFFAEQWFRSKDDAVRSDQRQTIGEVLGESVNAGEFQALLDEYQDVVKLRTGWESLTEQDLNQINDAVWNTFVQTKILESETSKLGIKVSEEEFQDVLNEGTNPMLRQTPFVDQQTGLFDANQLKKFLADYKAQQKSNSPLARQSAPLYHYWTFVEKSLRRQLLARKYETLFMHCLLSNPAESKALYDAGNEEAKIVLASFPYADVDDAVITIADADIEKKYEEFKPLFRQFVETRNIKFIDVLTDSCAADTAGLRGKFAAFVSKNQSAEDVIKNAEGAGYAIRDFNNLTTSNHNIANIRGTRDALKWVFDAKEGSVSPMYECGDNNHLLVVVLDKVNKKGYRSPDDEQVKEYLNSEVVKEKKADIILADIKGVKSINDAVSKGAKTDTIPQITFSSPVFVRTTGANEAQLAGAVASTGKGQFSKKPVVGDAGVYVFQVIDKTAKADKYDAEQMKAPLKQKAMQAVGNYMNELLVNAEVVDNRYIFF